MFCPDPAGKIIRVPTGFLGLGTMRYFYKDDVEILRTTDHASCSCAMGIPVVIKTKEGEVFHGYEEF